VELARLTSDSDALSEAREIFSELSATRWLERVEPLREVAA
jgi:hypothetical protein